ncbi:MAG: (2Fe-2S) ferredoxin domain-containing protein [Deltaproteobacteria bacterium]|nr:(2Fe-2S) ferredoxin domain-containing protein [Deltaproteobacteria bacterium]
MPKLSIEDLKKMREDAARKRILRDGESRVRITIHMGTCGIMSGARDVLKAVLSEVEASDLKDTIVTTSGCAGLCSREPMATVEIAGHAPVKYVDLTAEKVVRIVKEHIAGGTVVQELALAVGSEMTR